MPGYTPYHSLYLAHRITLEGVSDDAFAKSLSTARVEMNPHQVDAALFALQPPIPRGAILADEVGQTDTYCAAHCGQPKSAYAGAASNGSFWFPSSCRPLVLFS